MCFNNNVNKFAVIGEKKILFWNILEDYNKNDFAEYALSK